jgi:dTDP-4-amino-4,6-dideoxygalactose transaminase
MQIPSWPQSDEREAELLRMVLDSPQWGGFHPFVADFEKSFSAYQHAKYGIAAFNGTVTLELALEVLGIGSGDEVIVPAISFISTATAVSRVGALPVFVDIGSDTYNIDPERVREAITPRTRAIIPVHFGGTMCDVDALQSISEEFGVRLVEDAAQAHGSEWRGRRAGSFGIAGSFSFQNGKVLCSGEGGMLVSSDDAFAEAARSVVNCGRVPGASFYEHHRLGTNLRLTAFQAAILLAQFERLPEQIRRRTENALLLKHLLSDVPGIVWQTQPDEVTAELLVSDDRADCWSPPQPGYLRTKPYQIGCTLHAVLPSHAVPESAIRSSGVPCDGLPHRRTQAQRRILASPPGAPGRRRLPTKSGASDQGRRSGRIAGYLDVPVAESGLIGVAGRPAILNSVSPECTRPRRFSTSTSCVLGSDFKRSMRSFLASISRARSAFCSSRARIICRFSKSACSPCGPRSMIVA